MPSLTMGIYTRQNHVNIHRKCTEIQYGQLANKHLHVTYDRARQICASFRWWYQCRDTITVQDFMSSIFSFSFGYECNSIKPRKEYSSLKGLVYNFNITWQTSHRALCRQNVDADICHFESVTTSNLLGTTFQHSRDALKFLRVFYNRAIAETNAMCYQHFIEIACHIILPPCQPHTGLVIHPCKEACYDMIKMCKHDPDTAEIFGDSWGV